MAALGDAVHGMFATDSGTGDSVSRLVFAQLLMARWGVAGALSLSDVICSATIRMRTARQSG